MTDSANLNVVARQVRLPVEKVQPTVELLDEGNTVPFITRYRKDRTGGLDEEQIRQIQDAIALQRQLGERKQKILKSIESQEQLTDDLKAKISAATSLKTLEDLYLPFRPKKQTLATVAKQRGLEPLALEVLNATGEVLDLDSRCVAYIDAEKKLETTADVLVGVGHLLAEMLGDRADLRAMARKRMWDGTLVSKRIENAAEAGDQDDESHQMADGSEEKASGESSDGATDPEPTAAPDVAEEARSDAAEHASEDSSAAGQAEEKPSQVTEQNDAQSLGGADSESKEASESVEAATIAQEESVVPPAEISEQSTHTVADSTDGVAEAGEATNPMAKKEVAAVDVADGPAGKAAKIKAAEERRVQRREARRRKRQKLEQSFKDYFDYSEPISRLPHYRVLAINRGERCKVLRVKIAFDSEALRSEAEKLVVPEGHPYPQQLRDSLHDALTRLVVPSIDREIRRELTDRAEMHAVKVFAHNLRKLLLQPPLHHHRVLAVDPGFRSGCKLVAMDEFGNVLSHTLIHVIGAAERVQQSRQRLIEQIREHQITVVAIGNGTASRETEQLVAQILTDELSDLETKYLMVNEAGASVYSTSQTGREELPKYDATVRGAVSIGRRALDPLSELVKIDPANIGVGLYQHDIKAKHLRTSLDAVVESCVNYVGVDVNSASPALLGYVSGLNQLTARRLYEYRLEHGPFRNREQLKEVPGVGEATFVQAAGFLKIPGAENPLDETWIHPESYDIARSVLKEIDADVAALSSRPATANPAVDSAVNSTTATAEPFALEPDDGSNLTGSPAETPPAETPPAETPPAETPSAETPSAETPSAETPSVETPSAETPADETSSDEAALKSLAKQLGQVDVPPLAEKLAVGTLLLTDIMASLARPGRDPREDLSPPVFRREILKIENLKSGMKFSGAVLNVVDFGAFVDIGLTDSGLIHVSRLADRFISDPHDVVSVGDILDVWVVDVDEKRRRVSLTAIEPGTEKSRPTRGPKSVEQGGSQKRRRPPRAKAGEKKVSKAGSRGKGSREKTSWKPKKKSKPVVPITDGMADGSEPMRTFSDLLQFHTRKQSSDEPDQKDKKKSSKR